MKLDSGKAIFTPSKKRSQRTDTPSLTVMSMNWLQTAIMTPETLRHFFFLSSIVCRRSYLPLFVKESKFFFSFAWCCFFQICSCLQRFFHLISTYRSQSEKVCFLLLFIESYQLQDQSLPCIFYFTDFTLYYLPAQITFSCLLFFLLGCGKCALIICNPQPSVGLK